MAFDGPVYSEDKKGKNVVKIYAIENIELSWKFQFGAIWTRIGGDIIIESLM